MAIRRIVRVGWRWVAAAAVLAGVVQRLFFAAVPVESAVVERGPVVAEVMGTGTLEARVAATISPKIAGRLARVLVDQGDRVSAGDLLVTLDDGDLRQQVEIAEAALAATRATVDRTAAEIARAQAAATLARAEYERLVALQKSSAATPYELDKVVAQRGVAEAELSRAELAKVEAQRQVLTAEATLRYGRERLADTQVTCPFDGLVIRRGREPGDVVVPGTAVLQIIATGQMWVSAWVDETAMASVAVDQPARVVFRSDPQAPARGTVARRAPLADRETREFVVDVTPAALPRVWAVGQRAEVYIQTAAKDDALLVPAQAIAWRNGRAGVFTEEAGRARWCGVELGLRGADGVEVVAGLAEGQRVLWPPSGQSAALTEGKAVSVR